MERNDKLAAINAVFQDPDQEKGAVRIYNDGRKNEFYYVCLELYFTQSYFQDGYEYGDVEEMKGFEEQMMYVGYYFNGSKYQRYYSCQDLFQLSAKLPYIYRN